MLFRGSSAIRWLNLMSSGHRRGGCRRCPCMFLFPPQRILRFRAGSSFAFTGLYSNHLFRLTRWPRDKRGERFRCSPVACGIGSQHVLTEPVRLLIYLRDETSWNAPQPALWSHGSSPLWRGHNDFCSGNFLFGACYDPLRQVLNVFALGEEYDKQLGIRVSLPDRSHSVASLLYGPPMVMLGRDRSFVRLGCDPYLR